MCACVLHVCVLVFVWACSFAWTDTGLCTIPASIRPIHAPPSAVVVLAAPIFTHVHTEQTSWDLCFVLNALPPWLPLHCLAVVLLRTLHLQHFLRHEHLQHMKMHYSISAGPCSYEGFASCYPLLAAAGNIRPVPWCCAIFCYVCFGLCYGVAALYGVAL